MNRDTRRSIYDQWSSIATAIAFMIVGPAIFLIMPVFVGALAETLGFTDRELGFVASADLAGMAVSSIFMVKLVRKRNWRWLAFTGLLISILGNAASLALTEFTPVLVVRFLTGLGGGVVAGVVSAFIARTSRPDRVAAFLVTGQVSFTVVVIAASPWYLTNWGLSSIYLGLAGLAIVLMFVLKQLPTGTENYQAEAGLATRRHFLIPVFVVLGALMFFFIGQASIWAFIERMGNAGGLEAEFVAEALALSTLLGIAGAVAAAILDTRLGRFIPLLVAGTIQVMCLLVLLNGMDALVFLAALSLFQFGWNFALPYHIGVIVHRDPSASYVVLIPTFQAIGIALGPAIAGLAVSGASYSGVNLISIIAIGIYLLMILPYSRMTTTER